jgi:hypothetical protein
MPHRLRLTSVVLLTLSALCGAPPAIADGRAALVIGNSDYESAPALANPANDAADLGAALERLGFSVQRADNAGFDAMRRALRDFAGRAAGAEVALVYFAGHGIEIDGRNYLVPVDARLASDRDASFEAVPLDLVIDAVAGARGLRLVVLDACRDNPFAPRMERTGASRSIGRGLGRIEPETGTLVSYAAKEGTTAADGEGRNSPFAAALLTHLFEPGLEVSFLFRKVRDSVLAATGNAQEPFTYGSLPGRAFYLNGAAPAAAPPPAAAAGSTQGDGALDLAYWEEVRDSGDAGLLRSYLDRFPEGVFGQLAKARLAAIEAAAAAPRPPADTGGDSPEQDAAIALGVQRELARLGCDPGRPDGIWGARSGAALARYGAAAGGGPVAAGPDQRLLGRLLAETGRVCPQVAAVAPPPARPSPGASEAPPATRTFRSPQIGGLPVDICLAPFEACNGQAASRFCESQGFRVAQSSAQSIFPRTGHMTGGMCEPRGLVVCGGYSEIVCAR